MTRFTHPAGVALPVALLLLALCPHKAQSELITYEFEVNVGPTTFVGETIPAGPITGTLTFDKDAAPTSTAAGSATWKNALGPESELTLTLANGTVFSTAPGALDAAIVDFGSSSLLQFGDDYIPSGGTFTNGVLLKNGAVPLNPMGLEYTGPVTIYLQTTTDGPLGDSLADFDLLNLELGDLGFDLPGLLWNANLGGGTLLSQDIEITAILSSGSGAVVPEPHSVALWCLAAMIGVGFVAGRRRSQRNS